MNFFSAKKETPPSPAKGPTPSSSCGPALDSRLHKQAKSCWINVNEEVTQSEEESAVKWKSSGWVEPLAPHRLCVCPSDDTARRINSASLTPSGAKKIKRLKCGKVSRHEIT